MDTNDWKKLFYQLMKYGVVGGIAFIVDYGSLYLLTEFAGVHYMLSAAIAFILGLICNYILSTSWVFGESKISNKMAEFIGFAVIGVLGLLLNELIIYVSTDLIGLHYMVGKIISTAIVFFWNFFARRYLIFKS